MGGGGGVGGKIGSGVWGGGGEELKFLGKFTKNGGGGCSGGGGGGQGGCERNVGCRGEGMMWSMGDVNKE